MTNGNGFLDRAARRAQALPLARIVAAMLGASAAFFALAMPPRILTGLLGLAGLSVAAGMVAQLLFAALFALLVATAGWLAMTLVAGAAAPAPVVQSQPARRKRPIAATSNDPAPTLRRGDAHPDAPPRRPIFAKDDLGTPFDEIVTDRRIIRGAPEAEFATPDAAVDLDRTILSQPPIAEEPAVEAGAPVAVEQAPVTERAVAEEAAVAPEAPVIPDEPAAGVTEVDPVSASEPEAPSPEPVETPDPRPETRPDAPREDESIAALMARFEGGLGRLGGGTLPPPELSSLSALKRSGRNPDDALRDALEALQQMAARQR